ncbi:chromosomal replication initiator protein DnaA [Candidatus Saccharibacteria bacterium CG11_big_fil_rev_8_21_14_0_20_41_19]|nr:MAG: chromosomal replication initiator DnaA [Candidatus Saccharibacteria bacterium CG2_30_41_52]PIQ71255.1 MAG: chromosomal replication initiator protein DnaA [Candidatus Saccharibacteria bacterium CG11_big_fil_rev_8_21_14_0_20_41_19]PIZ59798.1 MAG: chromosomal replication initiator protein DnaA [Candidatus Saccharibacteria bacterium CG_4_10_14_0_2_um_filter_41_11]PJC29858.1 MAG: chromosomal replication initiator protein DnaA [Candidatus Saccharibacteria bacterium CG_4_9_14_0_2_um_filter_41_9
MYHALWQSVLGEIELTVPHATFTTWFKNTELVDQNDAGVVISVANIFAKKQFEVKFDDQIKSILSKQGINPKQISYIVSTSNKNTRSNRETTINSSSQVTADDLISTSPRYQSQPVTASVGGLNPRYTFDNFIVGSSNDLAYTASRAVAANPGIKYNPIYLYGGVGLGKTHLMQAIGNEIIKNDPKMRVLYISSETFVNEFLEYIRFKKKGFSEKYRNVDVLIIDDMQFIAGKEKTQEEFFHTFNHLHQNNKQIIICSDKPPKSIPTLTERLRSRFEMGMAIDIQMPDFETRCAILNIKASLSGVTLRKDTIEYLATNIKTNIRELEGALNRLLAYAEMRGVEPDISTAEGLLGNIRQSRPQHLSSKQIIDRTAKHFQLDVSEICSEKRDKYIVVPRQIAMYLLRSELHLSFPKIANELGRKDHTTAIHSIEKIEKAIKLDFLIREQVSSIREKLYA